MVDPAEVAADALQDLKHRSLASMPSSDKDSERARAAYEAQRARDEEQAARRQAIIALGGLRAYESYTLDRFVESPTNAAALRAARDFALKKNLMITGTVGTGKTHLAVAAARQHYPADTVRFLRQSELSREVRAANDAAQEGEIIKRFASAPVLIIDDLGAAKDTEFMLGLLYEIIDWRYMNKPGGLIVTSNRTLDQLAEKLGDDRVPSRLAQMCDMLTLTGERDHRIDKGQK